MPDKNWIEQVVQKAVSEVLDGHFNRLQSELVARVLREVEPQLSASSNGLSSTEASPADLLKAISAVQTGSTQREILRALLDGAARYTGRVALFVVKSGTATGWQARGFAKSDEIKDFSLDVNNGIAAQALQSRTPSGGSTAQMDQQFISRFQAPSAGTALVLPLVLKEKVAALVYADAGTETGGKLDTASLELLVITTSAWLEVVSLRKQSAKEGAAEASVAEKASQPTPARAQPAATTFSDPFASHAPSHGQPVSAPVAQAVPAAVVPQVQPAVQAFAAAATSSSSSVSTAHPAIAGEDEEIHRKAARFARLLVDEIKLYNQAKVSEGRKNRDLYDRLKEDIDKSFATYQKRYGNTAAAGAGYFSVELVRSLAEDDISVMGSNFQR